MVSNEYGSSDKMYSPVNIDFNSWLNNELQKRGWSQSDLATAAGLPRGTISNILNNTRKPGANVLEAIANGLHLPPETVYRAAGLLPPVDPIDESVSQLNHAYKQLSPRDQEEILDIVKIKLDRALLEQERQRAAKRIKTGPLPRLGG